MQEERRAAALLLQTTCSVLHPSDALNQKMTTTRAFDDTKGPKWQNLRLRRIFSLS
jgi:hypothetical protein